MIQIDSSTFIASTAVIIGKVKIGKNCGVFPHAVIRGDQNTIIIDDGSNVQDCCVIHTDRDHDVCIGTNVSLGHCSMVHGAHLENNVLVGIHATILNGAKIGKGSIIGANALITTNMVVPPYSLVLGIPGKIVKQDPKFESMNLKNAETYRGLSKSHKQGAHEYHGP
jgi:carbonic anhydrase/acetyltransferase-like protein (isoleucine patch superfamily)